MRDEQAAAKIKTRLARVRPGKFGNARPVGESAQELKIDYGPGYRVYFGQSGNELVILLCGGDKGNQDANIKTAKEYWATYKREKGHANY